VSSATRNKFFVDAESISVGADKVVRYIVVVEAAGGAKNVSFEGMRCESGERRLYAYGHPDGTWSKARSAGWESIKFRSLLSYQKALFEDHFCPNACVSGTPGGGAESAAGGTMSASVVKHARRIVVKVGSSLVTAEGAGSTTPRCRAGPDRLPR